MIGAKDTPEAADAANPEAADAANNTTIEGGNTEQKSGWSDPLVMASFILSILVFVKNVTTWTIFLIRRYIEQRDDVALRP